MSPIAQMPGTLVRHIGSVLRKPRSMATPSASSPMFSVFGTMPTATIAWLNWCSADLPSAVLIFAVTPLSVADSASTPAPVRIVMPSFSSDLRKNAETSSSSTGTTRSSISTTVTSAPKSR